MIVAMVSPALRLKTLLAPSAILGTAAVLAIRVRLPMLLLVLGDLAFPAVLGRGQGQREYHRYPLVEVRTVVDSAVAKDGLQEFKLHVTARRIRVSHQQLLSVVSTPKPGHDCERGK